ncbi:MAG: hypothetical protein ACYS6W_16070 [Planctomycetota bacterium]|jgi:hypothetical protein
MWLKTHDNTLINLNNVFMMFMEDNRGKVEPNVEIIAMSQSGWKITVGEYKTLEEAVEDFDTIENHSIDDICFCLAKPPNHTRT